MAWKAITVVGGALMLIGGAPTPVEKMQIAARPHAPPTFCEIRQATWCWLSSDATFEDRPSRAAGFSSLWIVRGGTWRNYPLVMHEPTGCRSGRADTVNLIKPPINVRLRGKLWNKIIVGLKKDGTCNLEFLYPKLSDDPQAGGFFAAMNLLRPCRNPACDGEPIGFKIRSLVDPT